MNLYLECALSQVASFGASLMDYNILTVSLAPKDEHEAQVQFALERGLPALLGVLSVHRLPFPSRSFDMAHCSRCLVQWTAYGMHCLNRVLLLLNICHQEFMKRIMKVCYVCSCHGEDKLSLVIPLPS